MSAPTAPASFATAPGTQSRTAYGDCAVTEIPRADLTWTSTALGSYFVRYELQRMLDSTWVDIARIIAEDLDHWEDYEIPRETEVSHRIRVVSSDPAMSGSPESDWATDGPITLDAVNCEWDFVSNLDPDLNVGIQVGPERIYNFPTADEVVVKRLWGRDFQATFRPLENRGVVTTLHAVAEVRRTQTTPGVRAFDALRAMSTDPDLPYVCVVDPYANRFLSTVTMVQGREFQPGDFYSADLTVIEITDTAYAPLVSLAIRYGDHVRYGDHIRYNGRS